MRIKITFANRHIPTYLPINNNHHLVQLIDYLTREYRRYLEALAPVHTPGCVFPFYTFSQLIIPEREIKDFKLGVCSPEFYWYLSSPYYQFLGIIARELRENGHVRIAGRWFAVKEVRFIYTPRFKNDEARFTCMSPVTVYRQPFARRQAGSYVLPDEGEAYLEALRRDLLFKYNALTRRKRRRLPFDLEFDRHYVRKRNNHISKVIIYGNGRTGERDYIRGVLAPVKVQAEPEVLQMIYDTGLGQLNNLGFGMVETVNGQNGH